MAKKDENVVTRTEKIAESTNSWIGAHAKMLIGIGVAVVVALLVLLVVFSVLNNKKESKFDSLTALETSYQDLENIGDEQFITECEALITEAGLKSYPGAKAALYLADVAYGNEDYTTALDWYTQLAEAQADTYLYQVATVNAAACNEMLNNNAEALKLYNTLWDSFGKSGLYGSRALFNAARIHEAQGNLDMAIASYEQLIAEYEDIQSEYAALAKTRLAQIN